jgi:replication-associated recombination protein RarA
MAALQACQAIGMPECRINLAHVVTYLSEAPKSTRALEAYNRACELAKQEMTLPVPNSMRNAPTRLMKELGYGEDYKYQPQYAYGPFMSDLMMISVDEKILGTRSRMSICRHRFVERWCCAKKAIRPGRSGMRTH